MLPSLQSSNGNDESTIIFYTSTGPECVRREGTPDIPDDVMVADHELLVLGGPNVLLALDDELRVAAHGPGHCLHHLLSPLL